MPEIQKFWARVLEVSYGELMTTLYPYRPVCLRSLRQV